jgi:hypothetical protein
MKRIDTGMPIVLIPHANAAMNVENGSQRTNEKGTTIEGNGMNWQMRSQPT